MSTVEELVTFDEAAFLQLIDNSNEEILLKTAEICLKQVIASNYVGYTKNTQSQFISEENARKELTRELNQPCVSAKSLWSLVVAKRILIDSPSISSNSNDLSIIIQKLRLFILWQQFLLERDNWILDNGTKMIEMLNLKIETIESVEEKIKIMLEMAYFHFLFYQYDKANQLINNASKVCNLNVDLTGMLGKRTRYQNKDIAQLVLVYENLENISDQLIEASNDIPADCNLNDDTLLENIVVSKNENDSNNRQVDGRTLRNEQLACLLWISRHEKMTHCADNMIHERCMPFINTVLTARRCWPLQSAALLLRAELEKSYGRRVDRSCCQTELISKLMQGIDDQTSIDNRLDRCDYVLASGLEPSWQANVLLSNILRSLGCTAEALLILEKLELWDNVIECYKSLGQMEKAESLIRRLLEEKGDDSMLYVYLGDITNHLEYYYKAIDVSNDRNAKAHKSLGHSLLMQKKYGDAYKHLRRSLELQPIQLGTWFNAGYCAWKLENYKDSTQCYHRCVSFQPDHFEAWNNLSAAYIRYGQKEKAWKLLQEALKFNYEHEHVWENYMLLSVDVGSFSQAIMAYHRLLDLHKRAADDEVLEVIATKIMEREAEIENEEGKAENEKEKGELIKLLARISANHQTLSATTLRVYAELKKPKELNNETRTEYEKYIQLLEKSFGLANGKQNWSKNEKTSIDVIQTGIQLAEDRLELAKFINSANSVKEASARIRLSIRGVITRIEKDENDRKKEEDSEKLATLLVKAKEILALVV